MRFKRMFLKNTYLFSGLHKETAVLEPDAGGEEV